MSDFRALFPLFLTGGTGSFGTAFIRQALETYRDCRIVVYSRDELKQFEQAQAFGQDPRIVYVIGDIRDRDRLIESMRGCASVVHAAAMKQVVAAERNPSECIRTNVGGAENVIAAARANAVQRVVALSTDKAVNPVNLYGATKLCSDKLFVNADRDGEATRFAVVRYGNVIGSRGSVVPFFRTLRHRGVLPITDPAMTRFWIRLPEGVRFAQRCLAMMRGGEVFIAKLPSMRITDLATAVAPECRQEITGIRPGEKLHEVMISEDDALSTLEFEAFYITHANRSQMEARQAEVYGAAAGTRVPANFSYRSDTNPDWVSADALRDLLPDAPE